MPAGAGGTSPPWRAAIIDQHAAAYILQGALDRLAKLKCNPSP
jgi:hypothetical protein